MAVLSIKSLIGKKKKRDRSTSSSSEASAGSLSDASHHSAHAGPHQNEEDESALFSSISESSSVRTTASEAGSLSGAPGHGQPAQPSREQDRESGAPNRRNSLESAARTLIFDDTSSTANTLLPSADHDAASVHTRVQGRGNVGLLNQARGSDTRTMLGMGRRRNDGDIGLLYDDDHSKTLPIYATRFKSSAHVYESDLAAKVTRTLLRRKAPAPSSSSLAGKGKGKSKRDIGMRFTGFGAGSSSSAGASSSDTSDSQEEDNVQEAQNNSSEIPMPPSIICQPHTSYNPFPKSRTLFMTMHRYGSVPGKQVLLGNIVRERNIELGLPPPDTSGYNSSSSTGGAPSHEKSPLCKVWQEVMKGSIDKVKYIIEFENSLDFAQATITMINDGSKRVTDTSYDGIRMRWYGTTGLASTFGSGFFELRFVDRPLEVPMRTTGSRDPSRSSSVSSASDSREEGTGIGSSDGLGPSGGAGNGDERERLLRLRELQLDTERRRPPVALYHNLTTKTLSPTRKVGEFTIWEPGYQLADIIVIMGLVLREQEQRKDVEYQHVVTSKFLSTF